MANAFDNGVPQKPLNGKAYGSIGHLPLSRVGPGDWHVHAGQARIACEKPRKGDRVIVTEKIDGSCCSVANVDGELIPLTRSGYRASDVTFEHLKLFGHWVERNREPFAALLEPGERVVGEWLGMAAGTRYDPSHAGFAPFIAFDLFRNGKRVLTDEFRSRCGASGLKYAHVIHDGPTGMSICDAMLALGENGFHGAIDPVEGAVWRVEREGKVDFLTKFVRLDKTDGKYFPNISGLDPVWHFGPCDVFGSDA